MEIDNLERIDVVLGSNMGTLQWDADLPIDIPVQSLIAKLISTPELPFRIQDDDDAFPSYRLLWREKERYLREPFSTDCIASAHD
jgi:hypothetical protein